MGRRTKHAPGAFSWVELATNDADGAMAFYGELCGWTFDCGETVGGVAFATCKVRDDAVAAIAAAADRHPVHWHSYVTVSSADKAAAKKMELGATVLVFDGEVDD